MKIIMKVQLACPLGVFNPGDVYENDEAACLALIAAGCAYDPGQPGPSEIVDEVETTEAAPMETAAKPIKRKRKYRRKKK